MARGVVSRFPIFSTVLCSVVGEQPGLWLAHGWGRVAAEVAGAFAGAGVRVLFWRRARLRRIDAMRAGARWN